MKKKRGAGILLPISSLPSPYGIGTLGAEAYAFVDQLAEAKQSYWQVLPVGPTSFGDSPYQSFSAFAGNPYFIDLDTLKEDGLLLSEEIEEQYWGDDASEVDYAALYEARFEVLHKAYARSDHKMQEDYQAFLAKSSYWLEDYSFYMALKFHFHGQEWSLWEDGLKFRHKETLRKFEDLLAEEIDFWKFCQYQFFMQWRQLKRYANSKGIRIIGDIPLYVAMDSADVWTHSDLFELDERKKPIHVAGVPPDCFSEDGQRWGNPLYRWKRMKRDHYAWWYQRMKANAALYDVIRIDHFIGIVNYWSIPASCPTAVEGEWRKGPGRHLTKVIRKATKGSDIIAEDLGIVSDKVRALINETGWPGMKILEFAFDGDASNEYLPHQYKNTNCLVYGGTHDNQTLLGYYGNKSDKELKFMMNYLHIKRVSQIPKAMLRAAYASIADTVIFQMQDILELDDTARMNEPSTVGTNWRWRMQPGAFDGKKIKMLRKMCKLYAR